jgi:hypothetical protein
MKLGVAQYVGYASGAAGGRGGEDQIQAGAPRRCRVVITRPVAAADLADQHRSRSSGPAADTRSTEELW